MTNFERIKEMTIEEMAEFIAGIQIREGLDKDIPAKWQVLENISRGQRKWLEEIAED